MLSREDSNADVTIADGKWKQASSRIRTWNTEKGKKKREKKKSYGVAELKQAVNPGPSQSGGPAVLGVPSHQADPVWGC